MTLHCNVCLFYYYTYMFRYDFGLKMYHAPILLFIHLTPPPPFFIIFFLLLFFKIKQLLSF
jgi:hypothetical protein